MNKIELETGSALREEKKFNRWYYNNEKNRRRVWNIWAKRWEKEEWEKDKPETPLTTEEETIVSKYYTEIVTLLEATDISDKNERMRAIGDWGRVTECLDNYLGSLGKDKEAYVKAMGRVIENAPSHPGASGDVLYIVESQNITQVEENIKRLSRTPIASEDFYLETGIRNYKANRILHTLTGEVTRSIYHELTAKP